MINAKDKFREGFIMLLRPFDFAELKNPLQKLTILWAYSEQPVLRDVLKPQAREKIDEICERPNMSFLRKEDREEWINDQIKKICDNPSSHEKLYEGEIVQTYVDGQLCRFYPDEYKILTKERLAEIMEEEGYHVILGDVKSLKDFNDKSHYLQSRGVSKNIADKWASLSFHSLVMYKPYFELLKIFCRWNEVYPDKFYEEVEGISIDEQKAIIETL